MPLVYEKRTWNKEYSKCPACNAYDKPKGGVLKIKGISLICSRYPDCKYSTFIPKKKKPNSKKLFKNIVKTKEELQKSKKARNYRKRQLSKLKKYKKKILAEKGLELKDVSNWKDTGYKELTELDNHFNQI